MKAKKISGISISNQQASVSANGGDSISSVISGEKKQHQWHRKKWRWHGASEEM